MFLLPLAIGNAAADENAGIYHDDPQHPWNQLYAAFYVRELTVSATGEAESSSQLVLGPDFLDPPLGRHPRFLLDEESFGVCNAALDRFIEPKAQRLISDALRRAVLQRDLWAVFDLLQADPRMVQHGFMLEDGLPPLTTEHLKRRDELSRKIATVMKSLALSPEEIKRLPDTLVEAVGPSRGDRPTDGLPPNLLDPKGPWLEIGKPEPNQFVHTRQVDGRSIFRVFYRAPDEWGRERLRRWLAKRQARSTKRASASPSSQPASDDELPAGMQFVLLRQMICLDEHLRPVPTNIVESVQIRITRPDASQPGGFAQSFFEYEMDRRQLFNRQGGGLRATEAGVERLSLLSSLGRLHTNAQGAVGMGQPFPKNCLSCHSGHTVSGDVRLSTGIRSLLDAVPSKPGDPSQAARTIQWKTQQDDYNRLVELWDEDTRPTR